MRTFFIKAHQIPDLSGSKFQVSRPSIRFCLLHYGYCYNAEKYVHVIVRTACCARRGPPWREQQKNGERMGGGVPGGEGGGSSPQKILFTFFILPIEPLLFRRREESNRTIFEELLVILLERQQTLQHYFSLSIIYHTYKQARRYPVFQYRLYPTHPFRRVGTKVRCLHLDMNNTENIQFAPRYVGWYSSSSPTHEAPCRIQSDISPPISLQNIKHINTEKQKFSSQPASAGTAASTMV